MRWAIGTVWIRRRWEGESRVVAKQWRLGRGCNGVLSELSNPLKIETNWQPNPLAYSVDQ